ncbi:MAG: hypothetical protein IPK55_10780 [Streptococcus sp.]|nr:hypothetical protein [Streptococcus sp.]
MGGIKIEPSGGTGIYSEHLKVPTELAEQVLGKKVKNKMSYADISKKFPTKPYLDILKESDDKYKRESAQIKLMNNLAKLDTLFYAQEQVKEYDLQENFQAGGTFDGGQFGGSGAGEDFNWIIGNFPLGQSVLQWNATDKNKSYDFLNLKKEVFPQVTLEVVEDLNLLKIGQTSSLLCILNLHLPLRQVLF